MPATISTYTIDGLEYRVTNNWQFAREEATALGYRYLGCGRHRTTYDMRDGWVLKIPNSTAGVVANEEEAEIYGKWSRGQYSSDLQYARCHLLIFAGVVCVRMEKVDDGWDSAKDFPSWVDYVDCCQVGFTERGQLVAYDYSNI
jgi:hypothetical protein